jgi:hypothetical protein
MNEHILSEVKKLQYSISKGRIGRETAVDKLRKELIKVAIAENRYIDYEERAAIADMLEKDLINQDLEPISAFEIAANPKQFQSDR